MRRACNDDNAADGDNRVEMLMWLTDPCRYDRWTRPLPTDSHGKTGGPTRVFARVYVYFLGSVEAQQLVSITRDGVNRLIYVGKTKFAAPKILPFRIQKVFNSFLLRHKTNIF